MYTHLPWFSDLYGVNKTLLPESNLAPLDYETTTMYLESLTKWCSDWKLFLNLDKCAFIKFSNKRISIFDFIYSIHSTPLPHVFDIKDLGVTFTSSFSFNKHINNVTAKSFRFLGFIKRSLKAFKDPDVLFSLYNSYIRSKLEYCSFIWSPSAQTQIDKIERVQKKFLKFVFSMQHQLLNVIWGKMPLL